MSGKRPCSLYLMLMNKGRICTLTSGIVFYECQTSCAIYRSWSDKLLNRLTIPRANLIMELDKKWLKHFYVVWAWWQEVSGFRHTNIEKYDKLLQQHVFIQPLYENLCGLPFSLCAYSVPKMEHRRNTILFSVRVPVLSEKMYSIWPRSSVIFRDLHCMQLSVSSSYRSMSLVMKKIWPIFTNSMEM